MTCIRQAAPAGAAAEQSPPAVEVTRQSVPSGKRTGGRQSCQQCIVSGNSCAAVRVEQRGGMDRGERDLAPSDSGEEFFISQERSLQSPLHAVCDLGSGRIACSSGLLDHALDMPYHAGPPRLRHFGDGIMDGDHRWDGWPFPQLAHCQHSPHHSPLIPRPAKCPIVLALQAKRPRTLPKGIGRSSSLLEG